MSRRLSAFFPFPKRYYLEFAAVMALIFVWNRVDLSAAEKVAGCIGAVIAIATQTVRYNDGGTVYVAQPFK